MIQLLYHGLGWVYRSRLWLYAKVRLQWGVANYGNELSIIQIAQKCVLRVGRLSWHFHVITATRLVSDKVIGRRGRTKLLHLLTRSVARSLCDRRHSRCGRFIDGCDERLQISGQRTAEDVLAGRPQGLGVASAQQSGECRRQANCVGSTNNGRRLALRCPR